MSKEDEVLVAVENRIKTITINLPKRRNALDPENAYKMALEVEKSADDGTRVLILTGQGGAFCAGADLRGEKVTRAMSKGALLEEELHEMLDTTYHRLMRAIYDLPRPVIAAVEGAAAGVGCSLALNADITLASSTAYFIQVFMNIALITDGGSAYTLPKLIGMKKAMEMVLTGDPVSADEALRMNMINRVYPPEELMQETWKWACRFAEGPVDSMGVAKRTLHEAQQMDFKESLDLECRRQARLMTKPDFLNAVLSFLQKKKPTFS